MEYYNKTGDIICDYYKSRNIVKKKVKSKSIIEYLNNKKKNNNENENSRSKLFEKYCQRTEE